MGDESRVTADEKMGRRALLHFDPVEYPITTEELAKFQTVAMRSGVSFCWLSTWEQHHEDKDVLAIFDWGRLNGSLKPNPHHASASFENSNDRS